MQRGTQAKSKISESTLTPPLPGAISASPIAKHTIESAPTIMDHLNLWFGSAVFTSQL